MEPGSKMAIKLNEEELFHLLDLYEAHDCLWNVSSPNYKNRVAREEAFIEILNNLDKHNLNIHELKNKIKSLRSTYNQELNKIKKSQENGNYIYKPQLVWFERVDSFLRKSADFRRLAVKMKIEHFTVKPELDSGGEDFNPDKFESEDEDAKRTETPKKKLCKTSDESLVKIKSTLEDISKKLYDKALKEDDEFELFGRNVGAQLKKLPVSSALNLQVQIQQLIATERIRLAANTNIDINHI